ncbi:Pup-like protein [Bifidobacterium bohemicum]|uniref:Prokaryotic ubiquitin-like protein Pup n=1 Tax=Bifidobacterium bohemicum DSM 22767 TaxID=1437606 RepID=A0A086ZFV0_9BIFI|nr:ubiquitin-like protein Pup [Bifidobacterium bohemicum]KFI45400.1 putative Pup-like protein [Bifidobacterium bohemicum DSM 22767]SCB73783.1 Pup-like protein [Bifidobacterium bohemicum]
MPQQFIQPQQNHETVTDPINRGQTGVGTEPLTDVLDAVLDDISTALDENAEEYVSSFVQKGGQ